VWNYDHEDWAKYNCVFLVLENSPVIYYVGKHYWEEKYNTEAAHAVAYDETGFGQATDHLHQVICQMVISYHLRCVFMK